MAQPRRAITRNAAPTPAPSNGLAKTLHEAQREPGPTFADQVVKLAYIRGWKVIRLKGAAEVLHGPDASGLPAFMMLRGLTVLVVWLNGSKRPATEDEEEWAKVFHRSSGIWCFDWGPEDVEEIESFLTDGTKQ